MFVKEDEGKKNERVGQSHQRCFERRLLVDERDSKFQKLVFSREEEEEEEEGKEEGEEEEEEDARGEEGEKEGKGPNE